MAIPHWSATSQAKDAAYRQLVLDRKRCRACAHLGLANPNLVDDGAYDIDEVGPWSGWQGALDAKIMVVIRCEIEGKPTVWFDGALSDHNGIAVDIRVS